MQERRREAKNKGLIPSVYVKNKKHLKFINKVLRKYHWNR